MKNQIIPIIIIVALLLTVGCASSNPAESSSVAESSESSIQESTKSSVESQSSTVTANNDTSSSNNSQSTSSRTESSSLQLSSSPQNQSPASSESDANKLGPAIDGANFYSTDGATIIIQGQGRFDLGYDVAHNLFGYMSFAGLEPTEKDYQMNMYAESEAIVFVASDFSHELRLEKTTGVAMYQSGEKIYYYTFPDHEYISILEAVQKAHNSQSSQTESAANENGALNVVTG